MCRHTPGSQGQGHALKRRSRTPETDWDSRYCGQVDWKILPTQSSNAITPVRRKYASKNHFAGKTQASGGNTDQVDPRRRRWKILVRKF